MSPYYEDAAHLLRFMAAAGLSVQSGTSYHTLIEEIAAVMETMCKRPAAKTHAEHADALLHDILGMLDWDRCRNKARIRAIAATTVGNILTRPTRRSA